MTILEKHAVLARERDLAAYRVVGGVRGTVRIAELFSEPASLADLRDLLADYDRANSALIMFEESAEWTGELSPSVTAIESAGNA